MNITVYLGASNGNDQNLILAARELGKWIGENGHTLVYGGSKCGLMGELAESVLKAKGKVIGVEPQFFIDAGFDYPKITQLIVTQDMSERKTGTLEEITEVMSKVSLKHLKTPCMLYNLNGYYDDLKKLLDKMITFDLSSKEKQEGIYFVENLEEIKEILK